MMENESGYNPEKERQLEELTEENLIKMMESEEFSRFERLNNVLSKLINVGTSAEVLKGELHHLISESNHRAGEHAYDAALNELSSVEDTIKRFCPNGKIQF